MHSRAQPLAFHKAEQFTHASNPSFYLDCSQNNKYRENSRSILVEEKNKVRELIYSFNSVGRRLFNVLIKKQIHVIVRYSTG